MRDTDVRPSIHLPSAFLCINSDHYCRNFWAIPTTDCQNIYVDENCVADMIKSHNFATFQKGLSLAKYRIIFHIFKTDDEKRKGVISTFTPEGHAVPWREPMPPKAIDLLLAPQILGQPIFALLAETI